MVLAWTQLSLTINQYVNIKLWKSGYLKEDSLQLIQQEQFCGYNIQNRYKSDTRAYIPNKWVKIYILAMSLAFNFI